MEAPSPNTSASPAAGQATARRGLRTAFVGLAIVLAGPLAYSFLLDIPAIHRTALPVWIASALGALVAMRSLGSQHRPAARVIAGMTLLAAVGVSGMFMVATRLPDVRGTARLETGEPAPEFTLPDQDETPVSLAELRKDQRVVLVFYRGHW